MKNGADKIDDVIGSSKNLRNMPIRGMNRRQNYRPYEPPQFNTYNAKDEVQKARSKALSGANLALAAGGIAAGAWLYYICYYIPSDLSTFCHSNNIVLFLLSSKEAWVLRGE
uniref:Cytochrome c oxidase assembly factor 3 n=1 Tax=Meloidogyne javanica TaxID=6303 RepID=A0A915N399_MELJA